MNAADNPLAGGPSMDALRALDAQLQTAKAAVRIGLLDLIEAARTKPVGVAERQAMDVLAPALFCDVEKWMAAVIVLAGWAHELQAKGEGGAVGAGDGA